MCQASPFSSTVRVLGRIAVRNLCLLFRKLERRRFALQYLKQLNRRRWHFNWVVVFNIVAENQSTKKIGAQVLGRAALQGGPP